MILPVTPIQPKIDAQYMGSASIYGTTVYSAEDVAFGGREEFEWENP